jgi:hypothetical protein
MSIRWLSRVVLTPHFSDDLAQDRGEDPNHVLVVVETSR